jgi:hypothetical protein
MQLDTAIQAAYEANLRKLQGKALSPPPVTLDSHQRAFLNDFEQWCRANGVRSCPAAPITIAVYLRTAMAEGDALAAAEAIRLAHQVHQLPCPVSTSVVRATLNEMLDDKPPRSWRADEQLLWGSLPPEIRGVISRRERERDVALRRLQSKMADKLKQGDLAEIAKLPCEIT